MYIYLAIKPCTLYILTQPAIVFCLSYRLLQYIRYPGILATYVNVSSIAAQRKAADEQPFYEQVRMELHQVAILKCTRLRLICIAHQVARHAFRLGQEAPLHTCRETRTTTAAQAAFLHLFHNIGRGHFKSLFCRTVATMLAVGIVVPDTFYVIVV